MAALWPEDASLPLFKRLRECFELKVVIGPEDAVGDESESLSALVSEAALSPRQYEPELSGQIAQEQMSRLKNKWWKKRQEELSLAIKKAETEGREEELMHLLTEKKALHNSLK